MVAMEFHDMLFKLKKIDKGVLIWPSFFYYRDHKHKDTNTRCQLPITCIILLSTLCEGACVSVWVCVCVCVCVWPVTSLQMNSEDRASQRR